jgi:uncharacterized secreted protein with C-terminal beta-propeller domain
MRMRWMMAGMLALAAGMVLAGCPRIPAGTQFTSADVGNSRGALNGPETDGATGAEGEGEGETPRTVTEPDVIRRVGNLLYVLNQFRGLSIVDLDSNTLLAQVPTLGFPRDLYLVGDRAYVLTAWGTNYTREGDGITVSFDLRSRVQVVDIASPADAEIVGNFDLSGDFIDSRLVGDILYAVTAEYQWYADGTVSTGVAKQQTSNSKVTSIAVGDPGAIAKVDEVEVPGYGNLIQATPEAIYVATYDWSENSGQTNIQYIDISDAAGTIVPRGRIAVPGYLADRFKMDEFEGVLRVVTNTWWPAREVYVTTVDLANPDALAVLGQGTVAGASGDTLFATRFDGPRAYLVTYFLVDPLHVIDLSDPTQPREVGELEVPGWSTHIEPQGDRLIALGVDDSEGQRRVSVSLFDVSNPAAPALLDRESFGENWSWSSAYSDVKAFTVLDDTLIVPFSGWSEARGGYERLQFLSYTRDTLDLRGFVDVQGQVLRSFEHGDGFYGVTTEQLAEIGGADLDSLAITDRVVLAENLTDVQQVSGKVLAEIITRYDSGDVLVRTIDPAGDALGEVTLKVPGILQTFLRDETLVLLGVVTDMTTYVSRYHVALVDLSDATAPKVSAEFDVNAQPYWGGWWYDRYGAPGGGVAEGGDVGGAPAKMAADVAWWGPWWWWTPAETSFLVGNKLVARCFSETFDAQVGGETPHEGLVIVDLDTLAVQRVGLGYGEVRSVDQSGDRLYLGTKAALGRDALGRGVAAFYVSEFDPATAQAGPEANVPGEFISYNAALDRLILRDYQYNELTYSLTRSLHTVRWAGDTAVTALDALTLPEETGSTLLVRGNRILHDRYKDGFELGVINVDENGALSTGPTRHVTNAWGYLLGASDRSAYVAVAGSILTQYDLEDGLTLENVLDVTGTPSRARPGQGLMFFPLGYSGLALLPF